MSKLIYINPGHGLGVNGRQDPGAIGPTRLTEAEVTQDIAQRVGHLLREKGLLAMSQVESFEDAARHANASKADLFVSIHCNAAVDPRANGTEVWYGSAQSKKLADAILDRLLEQISGGKGTWLQKSVTLKSRGVKHGGFYVLRATKMPAVLVEVTFISNPREEQYLRDPHFRQQVAQAIADGVAAHCGT